VTFATGGFADWFPTYLHRVHHMDIARSGMLVGAVTVVGGLVGTLGGGLLADRLRGKTRQPYLAVCACSMLPATILCGVALWASTEAGVIVATLACQICLWAYNGPVNTLLVNSVGPGIRARAFSLSILSIHLLGDVISPPLIGTISDVTGDLRIAVVLVPAALLVATILWALGWRFLREPPPDSAPVR
jgi:sugar phosphate permease